MNRFRVSDGFRFRGKFPGHLVGHLSLLQHSGVDLALSPSGSLRLNLERHLYVAREKEPTRPSVKLLPIAQRTNNAAANGVVGRTMGRWS